ncbi:O-acyltransferase like protein-like [Anopheles darlingi]|uniref:O-acyltransferase like protein-like n=1 Tax=Anopheles darlingi TaxID=43151 RepID=UPI0021000559|nr:O-acyltransferase like protein-like [Anopheles darlingi]
MDSSKFLLVALALGLMVSGILYNPVQNQLTLRDYNKLPRIYEYDEFNKCQSMFSDKFVYCVVSIKLHPNNSSMMWKYIEDLSSNRRNFPHDILERGLCLNNLETRKIDKPEMVSLVNGHFRKRIHDQFGLKSSTCIKFCWNKDVLLKKYGFGEIVFLCSAIVLLVIPILMTSRQLVFGSSGILVESFSIISNMRRLTMPRKNIQNDLLLLEGLRVIGMLTILTVHSVLPIIRLPLKNTEDLEWQTNHFIFPLLNSGNTHMIQFFFALGGMVFGLSICSNFDCYLGSFRIMFFLTKILRRLIRILPSYMFIIFYQATFYKRIKEGPLAIKFEDFCSENWWTNILFVNNYVDTSKPCLQYSWYLGVDFQLSLIATTLTSLMLKFHRRKHFIAVCMIISAFLIPAFVIYIENIEPTMTFNMRYALEELRTYKHFVKFYLPCQSNISSYFWGILVAFIYKRVLFIRFHCLQANYLFGGCLIALGFLNASTIILDDLEIGPIMRALYGSLLKNSWGLAFSFSFLYLAKNNNRTKIAKLLLHPVMQTIAKFCYSIYLVQYSVIYACYTNLKVPITYGKMHTITLIFAITIISTFAGILLFIAVEAPFSFLGITCLRLGFKGIKNGALDLHLKKL